MHLGHGAFWDIIVFWGCVTFLLCGVQNTPGTGQFGTEMLLWFYGYYADINSQIEKLVAKCIANI